MPKIDIRRPHQLSIAEARAVVDQVAARMHEKFGMDGRWQDDTLLFSRPGVSGSIAVGSDHHGFAVKGRVVGRRRDPGQGRTGSDADAAERHDRAGNPAQAGRAFRLTASCSDPR